MKTLSDATIKRETEKAYLVDATIDSPMGLKAKEVWFPKSRSNWDGEKFECEDWLIEAKNREFPSWSYGLVIL